MNKKGIWKISLLILFIISSLIYATYLIVNPYDSISKDTKCYGSSIDYQFYICKNICSEYDYFLMTDIMECVCLDNNYNLKRYGEICITDEGYLFTKLEESKEEFYQKINSDKIIINISGYYKTKLDTEITFYDWMRMDKLYSSTRSDFEFVNLAEIKR